MNVFRNIKTFAYLAFTIAFGVVGLQMGLQKRHRYLDHKSRLFAPITMTMEEFSRKLPSDGWYRITNALVYAGGAGFTQAKHSDTEPSDGTGAVLKVVASVYSHDQFASHEKASLVIVTENQEIRKVMNEMHNLGIGERTLDSSTGSNDPISATEDFIYDKMKQPIRKDDNKIDAWAKANSNRIAETRTIEGLIRTREEVDTDIKDACEAVEHEAAPRHVILEEGATPQKEDDGGVYIGFAIFFLVIGGIGIVQLLASLLRGSRM